MAHTTLERKIDATGREVFEVTLRGRRTLRRAFGALFLSWGLKLLGLRPAFVYRDA